MSKKIKMVLEAEPGVGKSTFASKAPHPFFITTDGNYEWLGLPDEDHVQVYSWAETKKVINELVSKNPKYDKYETIVVDLIEDTFKWCEFEYCQKNKLEHISDVGYAKGYDTTRNEFYIEICKLLGVDKHILFLTHGYTKVEKDRRGAEFYKYYPSSRIPDKVWDMIEGRVRYFLRAYVKGEEENNRIVKRRYLSLIPKENEGFCIARGLDESKVPEDINLEWSEFVSSIGLNDIVKPSTTKHTVKSTPVKETPTKPVEEITIEDIVGSDTVSVPEVEVISPVQEPFEVEFEMPDTIVEIKAEPKKEEPKKELTQEEKIAAIKAKLAAMKNKEN